VGTFEVWEKAELAQTRESNGTRRRQYDFMSRWECWWLNMIKLVVDGDGSNFGYST
jgi:hypothetical protein